MKKTSLMMIVSLIMVLSCKKDRVDIFQSITLEQLKELEVQYETKSFILKSSVSSADLGTQAIVFFKTSQGTFGKFKILGITANFDLKVDMVIFDPEGKVAFQNNRLLIPANNSIDLDTGKVGNYVDDTMDLVWDVSNEGESQSLVNLDICRFYVYKN